MQMLEAAQIRIAVPSDNNHKGEKEGMSRAQLWAVASFLAQTAFVVAAAAVVNYISGY